MDVNHLPYIAAIELLAMKVFACGLRLETEKKTGDAIDAEKLAEMLTANGRVALSSTLRRCIMDGLDSVVKEGQKADGSMRDGRKSLNWWNANFELQ